MDDQRYFQIIPDNEFIKLLKPYNRTIETFNEDITTIENWMRLQPHLPQYTLDRNIIAYSLFENKCSIEKTKTKMDWLFTVHSIVPEFFKNSLPWSENLLSVQKYLSIVILPNLTEANEIITYLKYNDAKDDDLNPEFTIAALFNSATLCLLNARANGRTFIVDGKYAKLSYMKYVTPSLLKKVLTVSQNAFSLKFNSIHFINTPPYFGPAITIIKQLLKKKLRDRFLFHENHESLVKAFTKECLPKDCGGDLPTLEKLQENMNEQFLKQKAFYEARESWTVDESKRPQNLDYSELLGTQGNFRKLDLD